jgi:hypothetical protein
MGGAGVLRALRFAVWWTWVMRSVLLRPQTGGRRSPAQGIAVALMMGDVEMQGL